MTLPMWSLEYPASVITSDLDFKCSFFLILLRLEAWAGILGDRGLLRLISPFSFSASNRFTSSSRSCRARGDRDLTSAGLSLPVRESPRGLRNGSSLPSFPSRAFASTTTVFKTAARGLEVFPILSTLISSRPPVSPTWIGLRTALLLIQMKSYTIWAMNQLLFARGGLHRCQVSWNFILISLRLGPSRGTGREADSLKFGGYIHWSVIEIERGSESRFYQFHLMFATVLMLIK